MDADIDRVDSRLPCDLVYLTLANPLQMRGTEGAVGPGGRSVGVHAIGLDLKTLPTVRTRCRICCGRDHPRTVVGISAGIHPEAHMAGEQSPIRLCAGAHPTAHIVTPRGHHRFVHAVGDTHGAAGFSRQGYSDRLHLGVGLAAEAAAEKGDDDAHTGDRQVEQLGQLGADKIRMLA